MRSVLLHFRGVEDSGENCVLCFLRWQGPSTVTAVKKVEVKSMANRWTFFSWNAIFFLNLLELEERKLHQEPRKEGKIFGTRGCRWRRWSRSDWRAPRWSSATAGLRRHTQAPKT